MKAILMKVNYDTKYTSPHKKQLYNDKNSSNRSNGFTLSKHEKDVTASKIKTSEDRHKNIVPGGKPGHHKSVQDGNHRHNKPAQLETSSPPPSKTVHKDFEKINSKIKQFNAEVKSHPQDERLEKHKEGVAKAHSVMRLNPLNHARSSLSTENYHINKGCANQMQRLLDGPYTQKIDRKQTLNIVRHNTNNGGIRSASPVRKSLNLQLQARTNADRGRYSQSFINHHQPMSTTSFSLEKNNFDKHQNFTDEFTNLARSKTVPFERSKLLAKPVRSPELIDLERRAKVYAERAVRNKKIFSIVGPYPALRNSLRRRGWVEKFINGPPLLEPKSPRKSANASDDDNSDDENKAKNGKVAPWEEENGKYNLMSHIVREVTPTFIWTVKAQDIEIKFNKSGQIVNHFANSRSLTTKSGLVSTMKNVLWFDTQDPDTFFPRCYRLNNPDEREEFIEDYRLTACINIIKWIVNNHYNKRTDHPGAETANTSRSLVTEKTDVSTSQRNSPRSTPSESRSSSARQEQAQTRMPVLRQPSSNQIECSVTASPPTQASPQVRNSANRPEHGKKVAVTVSVVEACVDHCHHYLSRKDHLDIDGLSDVESSHEISWDQVVLSFYKSVLQNGRPPDVTPEFVKECEDLLERLRDALPQYSLDGIRNVWIIKPGSLSRGRGIACCNRLEEILLRGKDESFVAQKYIEWPLLIHNTKFDIRQWFLVTDWNPLTIWFYKDSYLRFCSQEYTLDDFHQSIHLANNSVQKHFKNGVRSDELPDDNMWSSDDFQEYLRSEGHSDVWRRQIYAGMKKAVITVLVASQESIENRRSAFALYGADFMVTEDFRPWLLEINSSPTMARNTRVTNRLCVNVLEDTIKVVLDRRQDPNTSTGRFEMIYKQPHIGDPPLTDISMAVVGKAVTKKKQPVTSRDRQATLPSFPRVKNH